MVNIARIFNVVGMGFLLLQVQSVSATHGDDDLFELSLSELVNLKVSVASFQEESLNWSSATVTRYSRIDMEALGIRSIPDLLRLVPGVVVRPGQHGNEQIMVRGIIDSWNQKVLFLLDDTPYWMPSHGEIPLRGVPFIAIDHIEVIRGPGAVVHGSNATSAVIKVVTRKDYSNDVSLIAGNIPDYSDDISLVSGSNSRHDGSAYVSNKLGEFDYKLSVQSWDGGDIDGEIDGALAPPSSGEVSFDRKGRSGMFQANLYGVQLMLHRYETTYEGIDGFASANNYSSIEHESELARLAYSYEWESFSLEVHTEYNQSYFTSQIANITSPIGIDIGAGSIEFENEGKENYRWRSGWIANYQIQQHLITLGYDYEERSTESLVSYAPGLVGNNVFTTLFPANREFENTAYIQDDWTIGDWRFVAGVRYVNEHDAVDSEWLPRIAVMYRFDDKRTLRAMYGVGFNAPSFAQDGNLLTNVILPPPNEIQHEKIKATELAYREQYKYWLWGVNAYYFKTEDFINPILNNETTLFENAENYERYGLEIEVDFKMNDWRVFSNLSYQYQGGREIDDDPGALLVPKVTSVLGVEYRINNHVVGASWLYNDSHNLSSEIHQFTANYAYRMDRWRFSVSGRKLLDDETETQDSRTQVVIIQEVEPEVLFELRYTFD